MAPGSTTRPSSRRTSLLLFVVASLLALESVAEDYPMSSLRCVATLAKPNMEVVCPQDRQGGCEKNMLPTIPDQMCGKGLYFGFELDPLSKKCIWRRCTVRTPASIKGQVPEPAMYNGYENGFQWNRWVCDDKHLCNASSSISPTFLLGVVSTLGAWLIARTAHDFLW